MAKLLPILFLFLFSCAGLVRENKDQRQKEYVWGSSDIPLFESLKEIDGENTNFDSITGNIVIASYKTGSKTEDIHDFYLTVLPQFGWKMRSDLGDKITYKRSGDKLEISLKRQNNKSFAKFFISYNHD